MAKDLAGIADDTTANVRQEISTALRAIVRHRVARWSLVGLAVSVTFSAAVIPLSLIHRANQAQVAPLIDPVNATHQAASLSQALEEVVGQGVAQARLVEISEDEATDGSEVGESAANAESGYADAESADVGDTGTQTASDAPAETPAPAVSDRSELLTIAAKYLGVPYKFGGTTPDGFDCSGYTAYVFNQVGVSLPRRSQDQAASSTRISKSDAKPGDLVFFGTDSSDVYHVGIYAGDGMIYDAASSGKAVSKRSIWTSKVFYGRV